MKFQITFLGANSLFGRVATALLSKTPYVRALKLYDEVENPQPGSASIPTCHVQWHKGKEELTIALQGSDIVVIGDDSKVILNNEKDALISTASKVVDFAYAVSQTTPKAMVVVAASPLNLMVPLAGYVLKELGCYDGRKLLGVTSVDTLRANAIYSEYISQPNSILPVVGGASPQTRVPIFSHARPSLDLSEEDMHRLIDKIKSFDLNMEGPELKASTLERAYATVRLVNSLLSGLREEPCTKEMALAKTSLIPEVNYFSLPVDLGKSGIERTFGLPQLSQLETEMIDYAIINLNNDLIKAQDLYASFKPCFEMLKSIVGCSSRGSTGVANDGGALLSDSKTKIQQMKDEKLKERSIKRKRNEQHLRNRKRSRTNKFPIIHCPAHEVVTDMPIEEKFGKIERAHKKLQVNQIFQERNAKELPVLKSNKGTDSGPSHNQLNETNSSLEIVIKNCGTKNVDLAHVNIDLVPNDIKESMKPQQLPLDKSPKTVDLMDLHNNSKAIHKAANQNFDCKNVLKNLEDPDISKNVKVTIDLKCKVKKYNIYEHLQPQAQGQSSRMETIKSLMMEKQKQYKKIKDLNLSDSSSNKDNMEYLKKKAMELKTPNIVPFSNKPNTPKLQSSGNHKTTEDKSYKDTVSGVQINKATNMEKLQGVDKIEKTNTTIIENDSVDNKQHILLKKGREKQNEIRASKQEIDSNDIHETIIPKEEVNTKQTEENNCRNLLENKDNMNMKDGMNHKEDKKIGIKSCFKNIEQVEKIENVYKSHNLKNETNKNDEKDRLKPLAYVKSNTELASQHNKNISVTDSKDSEINKNNIINEEKVALTKFENGITNNKSDCNFSITGLGKNNEPETSEMNLEQIQVSSKAETKKEVEKQLVADSRHEVNKQDDERFNEEMSKLICEVADSNKSKKEISEQKCLLSDEVKAVEEVNAQEKLQEVEHTSKRQEIDNLEDNNQKINNAITSKESYNPLEKVNEYREVTIQELKEPSKSPILPKRDEARVVESVEEKVEVKEGMKSMAKEETEVKKEKSCDEEGNVAENIEVFKYVPQKIHETRNITNINEIIQDLVKTSKPEENSELPIVDANPVRDIKDQVHVFDSKAIKMKVANLNKKAGQLTIKRKQQSKSKNQKKIDEQAKTNTEKSELKKPQKETPLPFMEMPKDERFDKNEWLKQNVQTVKKINSSNKSILKTIDESNAHTIYSRNINESFTKILQYTHGSNKTSDKTQLVSYAVDTKTKKDELSKRYTVLKKGQLCNMVKDDINANKLKAKLYQSSQIKKTIKQINKQDDNKITSVKGSFTESLKSLPTNKDISISGPSPNVLMATKKVSYNLIKDRNNLKNSNNNAITLNKNFFNLIINRVSKRSPALNETSEAIGVRGSHNGSGTYSKNNASDEEKIQQLTKKAKEQLTMTKFKNHKRISNGRSGSLPVVSNELGQKRQPAIDKERDKPKPTNELTDIMMRNKNKIQLMKERHQRLKNENPPPKNFITRPPNGTSSIAKSTDKKIAFYGVNTPIIESSNSSKNNQYEVKKGEIISKQDESFSVKPIRETLSMSGKTKSEHNDSEQNERDESLGDISTNRKQAINSSDALKDKHSTGTEVKCPEFSENQKPATSGNDDKTTLTFKKSSQGNQQSSEDKNKSNKECLDKQQELPKKMNEEDKKTMSYTKPLKEETVKKIKKVENKKSTPNTQPLTPRKKVFHNRAQEIGKFKSKESIKESQDISHLKKSANTVSKEKSQQLKVNLVHEKALKSIKSIKQKSKPANEHQQREVLQTVFSSRPNAWDLIKMKQEQKTDNSNITVEKVPSYNFGVRAVVGNNLIPRHSTASSLLIDPDIERRSTTSRKEIHPSLMHAVKPFHSQKTDLTKLKTNFYSRWTPETLKLKENKQGGTQDSKYDSIQKNPFVSGKISLTSDLFKDYMKKNRNHEFPNSNGDVQFLHQSGQLASNPQQGVAATTSRINDQRVSFSTLEANSEKKVFPKHELIKSKPKISIVDKTSRPRSSLFNKSKRINAFPEESLANEDTAKDKNTLHGSSKSLPPNKLVSNKSNEKLTQQFNPFRCREKEVDLKRIHLLKAFQNQEKSEMRFGELQRNYKKQVVSRTPENVLKNQGKELPKETPNRLQMLKRRSVESIKHPSLEDNSRNKKPFSAPGHYHPSFPLSKPKKNENNNKKDECGNSTLKKRWTQLLDIFQSVITTEKKNWEQDSPERNVLVAGGPPMSKSAVVPKAKIVLREPDHNPDSTGKRVKTYYRSHCVGGSKFQSSYSPINTTNKM